MCPARISTQIQKRIPSGCLDLGGLRGAPGFPQDNLVYPAYHRVNASHYDVRARRRGCRDVSRLILNLDQYLRVGVRPSSDRFEPILPQLHLGEPVRDLLDRSEDGVDRPVPGLGHGHSLIPAHGESDGRGWDGVYSRYDGEICYLEERCAALKPDHLPCDSIQVDVRHVLALIA